MPELISKLKIYGPQRFFSYVVVEVKNKLIMQLLKQSYSQKGEDLVIDALLGKKKKGFYVDVGAYDPDRFSNTKKFYKRGWTGINIEPDQNNFNKFLSKRKNDINLNIGIADKVSSMDFYKFIPDTLSTFSKRVAERYIKQGYRFNGKSNIRLDTLANVFSKYVKKHIDFISIDTEGLEMRVLKGNDWEKFTPTLICIESFDHSINGKNKKEITEIHGFFLKKGYEQKMNNGLNCIYKLK